MITQVLIGAVLFVSAAAIGITGFGFNLLSVPTLTFFLPVKYVVPFSMVYSFMLNTSLFLTSDKDKQIRSEFRYLIPAMTLGVIIGVFLIGALNDDMIRKILGIAIIIYAITSIVHLDRWTWRIESTRWASLFGVIAGSMTSTFGIGGPAIAVYVRGRRFEKILSRNLLLAGSMFMQSLAITSYFIDGMIGWDMLRMNLLYLPVVCIGVYFGNRIFHAINLRKYNKVILALLLFQGVLLAYR